MRLAALFILRMLSVLSGLLALFAAGKCALGAYAVFTVQKEFPNASYRTFGEIHGQFIDAPLLIAIFFALMAFVCWHYARRLKKRSHGTMFMSQHH
jgi:hypothetical protein